MINQSELDCETQIKTQFWDVVDTLELEPLQRSISGGLDIKIAFAEMSFTGIINHIGFQPVAASGHETIEV